MSGRTGRNSATQAQPERVMLVGVMLDKDDTGSNAARLNGFQTALAEAVELVKAAGGDSVRVETAKRDRPHTALFVGTGKAAELSEAVAADGIDLVVFNHELTPTQERNLEKILQCRVLDRVGLILAIFARRARTQEGRLQVELAQLSHLAGRLIRGYGHLQSQRGGIGMKGPGETKLETDRRLTAHRINALKKQLANLKKQRALRRKSRESGRIKTFALVGYTNCRQIQPVQPADQVGHICERPAFRHSRHDGAAAVHQSRMQHYPDRYRRIRQRSAAQTDFGIFRHAGRNRASRCAAARRRCRCPEQRTAD